MDGEAKSHLKVDDEELRIKIKAALDADADQAFVSVISACGK